MLNRTVWNKSVFDIETVFMLNWIVWIRTVWINWIVWNRNFFFFWQLNCVFMINWIVWNRTVYLCKIN